MNRRRLALSLAILSTLAAILPASTAQANVCQACGIGWHDVNLTAAVAGPLGSFPKGFVREDGQPAITYTDAGGFDHIHQLLYTGMSWVDTDLNPPNSFGGSNPVGFVRSDGVTTIDYAGSDQDIHELALDPASDTWTDSDLTWLSQANVHCFQLGALGPPSPLIRSDGVSIVVYSAQDGHVHQLALVNGSWHDSDLSVATGTAGGTEAFAFTQGNGTTGIVYAGPIGDIHELTYSNQGTWTDQDLSAAAGAGSNNISPFGYVGGDGVTAVVYQSSNFDVHELSLTPSLTWVDADLTTAANTDVQPGFLSGPRGYANPNGTTAVAYAGADQHVHQLTLSAGVWTDSDLTTLTGAPGSAFTATPYRRANGAPAIVYVTPNWNAGEVHQLSFGGP
jgi:hypothetical protein